MNPYFEALKVGIIVFGIFVLLIAALFLGMAVKGQKKGRKKKKLFSFLTVLVTALSLAITAGLSYAAGTFSNSIDMLMSSWSFENGDGDLERFQTLASEIAEEGMVLMKNEGGALPLSDKKVNLLGYVAYHPLFSGAGTGVVSAKDPVGIVQSLEDAGIKVNPAFAQSGIYGDLEESGTGRIGFIPADFSMKEIEADAYTDSVSFDQMKAYSDTAIIVLGRTGAEGKDLPYGENEDYLALDSNEEALLAAACKTFETVIVVINSGNAMELDWMNDYEVDAVIWAGLPGPYGFSALGKILTGEVNPSGRLPDTWVYRHDSHPASENFGVQEAANAEGRYYLDYVEGIYVGYKWYETAYAEQAVITNTKTGETFDYSDYDSVVAYPFGHGLSYTAFTQEITGGTLSDAATLGARETYTLEVTVTNTGDVAGKSVVQLYATVPYTEYDKANHVEKPEVELIAYGKTDILAPKAAETVVLEFSMEDLASYDTGHDNANGTKGAYMLDAGDYVFSVRADAHNTYDSIKASLSESYFFSDDDKRDSDVQAAFNHFEQAARGEYLSRQNAFANYASAMGSVQNNIENLDYFETDNVYDDAFDTAVTRTYKEGVDYAVPGELRIEDMAGLDYDDEKWDALIAQLTMEDLNLLTGNTMYSSPAIPTIGKVRTVDTDGPLGISSMFSNSLVSVGFPCVPLLAATFHTDLAYEMGRCVAEQANYNHVTGWYAPGINTHRFFYGGRNFEYYSEDATLGAMTAAAEVQGARAEGLTVYVKHFVLNDMEQNRAKLHTYCNEQALREIYLKPAEYAVKYGKATGVMSSMNYIGDTYAGGHVGLLTDVLRGEWGFQGCVLTDMDQAGENRSFLRTIRAGVDVWLGFQNTNRVPSSDADIYYLQRAAHNHLYAWVNGNTHEVGVKNWKLCFYFLYAELILLAISCVAAIVIRIRKPSPSVV